MKKKKRRNSVVDALLAFVVGKLLPVKETTFSLDSDDIEWASFEKNQLENSTTVYFTHNKVRCIGEYCTIHNRSDHPMRSFAQYWRGDLALMERVCAHGIGHPDPDEIDIYGKENEYRLIHGCDGCCAGSYKVQVKNKKVRKDSGKKK
jgi:hypothetical protein